VAHKRKKHSYDGKNCLGALQHAKNCIGFVIERRCPAEEKDLVNRISSGLEALAENSRNLLCASGFGLGLQQSNPARAGTRSCSRAATGFTLPGPETSGCEDLRHGMLP